MAGSLSLDIVLEPPSLVAIVQQGSSSTTAFPSIVAGYRLTITIFSILSRGKKMSIVRDTGPVTPSTVFNQVTCLLSSPPGFNSHK
jgi:hypothetical protein